MPDGVLEELKRGPVLRLADLSDDFPPDSPRPLRKHFELSSIDKQAEERGEPALLSVWDLERTTAAQARAFRTNDRESLAFQLRAEQIRALGASDGSRFLRVLRAPLNEPERAMPGADGHCGIAGLSRPPGEARAVVKDLQVRLSEIASRLEEG